MREASTWLAGSAPTLDPFPGARLEQASRYRHLLLLLLVAIYISPGLIGHDPWKQDETYVTSIVAHLERTHDWIVPRSAGQPFLEKPPLRAAGKGALLTMQSGLGAG